MDARVLWSPLWRPLRPGLHTTPLRPSHRDRRFRVYNYHNNFLPVEGGGRGHRPMRDETNPANIRLEHHPRPHPYHRVDGDQRNQRQESGLIAATGGATLLEGVFSPP